MNTKIYANRRMKLASLLKDGLALIPSAGYVTRSNDTEYPFRQDSNFYYLTGFIEPDSLLVICTRHEEHKSILFVRPKDEVAELWTGKRFGIEKAQELLGVDKVYSINDLDKELPNLLKNHKKVYFDLFKNEKIRETSLKHCSNLARQPKKDFYSPESFENINPILGAMRFSKEGHEIDIIKKACDITAAAHKSLMGYINPGMNEKEVEGYLDYFFKKNGADEKAYGTIVAGGDNANILHYVNNNMPLNDGDLVLIDAGCELETYASDITRTFPVNGKFTAPQRDIYQLVLDAQKNAIDSIQLKKTLKDLHEVAVKTLVQGMIDYKILSGSLQENLDKTDYRKYFPHGLGHWMGLDVHDNVVHKDSELNDMKLQIGSIFTVEPGLYLPKNDQTLPEHFRGIGVRIEDNILITENGFLNLTEKAPKEISEIEEACQ